MWLKPSFMKCGGIPSPGLDISRSHEIFMEGQKALRMRIRASNEYLKRIGLAAVLRRPKKGQKDQ